METENNVSIPKKMTTNKKIRRILKKLTKIFFVLIVILIIAIALGNKGWIASGTSKWEKVLEKDGVTVYTLKRPGKFVLEVRAIKTINSKLAAFVSIMQDIEAMCTHGCYDARVITKKSSKLITTFTRFDFPFPMQDREWVLENRFYQDSITKEIRYEIHAVPDLVPQNRGYTRIQHFKNLWRFIPKEDNKVEVIWQADMDQGNNFVNFLFNFASPEAMHDSFLEVEEMLKDEKYQTAKYDFITEVDDKIVITD